MSAIGVLVMAYGGPRSLDDIGPYLRDVRSFRETPQAAIDEVKRRYELIGGRSPILQRTEEQAAALGRVLRAGGGDFDSIVGMRHWHPYISDALARLEERGIRRAVGLVMAPHYSRMSIGAYFDEVKEAQSKVEIAAVEEWHLLPAYINAVVERVRAAVERFPEAVRDQVPVIFTAHSLPERILSWDDPYPAQLRATVDAVMEVLGPRTHHVAYQSAGMSKEPWLGPDVDEVMVSLADAGCRHVLVAPIGFVAEHVEILYDLDIELLEEARGRGVQLERIEMLNDSPTLIAGLAQLVRRRAEESGWL